MDQIEQNETFSWVLHSNQIATRTGAICGSLLHDEPHPNKFPTPRSGATIIGVVAAKGGHDTPLSLNEQVWIRRAQQGDTAAFEQLVNLHAPYVYNLALRTLSNQQEAEDITQEAFVRVWRSIRSFRADALFRTWLYRIVTNLCYNRLPTLKRELASADEDLGELLPDDDQRVEQQLVSAELSQQLHAAIGRLPEHQRLLITLRHLQGMRYNEIATVTQLPLGTVKTHIFRARRALRAELAPYLKDYERL